MKRCFVQSLLIVSAMASLIVSQEVWTRLPIKPVSESLTDVFYAKKTYVAVGNRGAIITSDDGISWIKRSSGTQALLTSITYGNDKFMVIGDSGTVLTSDDGVTWANHPVAENAGFESVAYGAGRFVAGGSVPYSSTDGLAWIPNPP
jgi:photosystem II stability/assembly factor-like uncharacterized protein